VVKTIDLLIAATAIEHDATVLHYDEDFDLIGSFNGYRTRWIVLCGTGHGGSLQRPGLVPLMTAFAGRVDSSHGREPD